MPLTEILILLFLMLFLFLTGMPVAFVLTSVGIVGIFLYSGGDISHSFYQFAWQFWAGGGNFLYICVPLFIYIANILGKGNVSYHLYDVASKWLRRLPGGLGISTIGACTIFSALSGTSVATAATIGLIAYPEMSSRGYPKRITMGALSAGGGLGMLIPPSVPLIIYGAITGESIGKLFIAGIIPGIMLAFFYALLIAIRALRGDIKVVEPESSWREKLISVKKAFWGLALIPVILGGMYAGFFTPTEAGAVGMVLSTLVVLVIYKTVKPKDLFSSLMDTMRTSVMIYLVLLGSSLFSYMVALYGIPALLTEWIINLNVSPMNVILMLNLFCLILGCFIDPISMMVIILPMVYPVVIALGFSGIWFGIVLMVNFNMAVETPPVGLNLFVLKGIDKDLPLAEIIMGVLPFYSCELLGLLIVILFPALSLWLPMLMGG